MEGVGRRPAQARFGISDQSGAAMPQDRAVRAMLGGEPVDIGLADGRIGAEHADDARLRGSAAGLIAGTVPTTGMSSAARTWARATVAAVLQAMTAMRGR